MSERKEKSDNIEEEIIKNERMERKTYFYVKERDLKGAFLGKSVMVLIWFREVLLFRTNFNLDLPSGFVSLLLKFEDVFPNKVLSGPPPLRLSIKLILCL